MTIDSFDDPTAERFRDQVRTWFQQHLPPGWGTSDFDSPTDEREEDLFLRSWQRTLHEGGWAGLSWPREYGGQGASLIAQAIFQEERDHAKAPPEIGLVGIQMVGPMLIHHGTEEQKQRYLPTMLTGEEVWAQGFSEPDAGSDLASLTTRAQLTADGWSISGQKVWTSRATVADQMILLARTHNDRPRHQGISALIVPMDADGLTIRPIRQINGSTEFSEVFLDDVIVAEDHLIGAAGDGWNVAITTLMYERIATTRAFEMRRLLRDLIDACRKPGVQGETPIEDAVIAEALARHVCDAHAAVLGFQRTLLETHASGSPGPGSSVGKLATTELSQRISGTAVSVLEAEVLRGVVAPWRGGSQDWALEFINGLKHTIAAGTSQIQRNIIGDRVLGLPR